MRNTIRIEEPKMYISYKKSFDTPNVERQILPITKNIDPQLKMHIALKISRFFELKIEDDFYTD